VVNPEPAVLDGSINDFHWSEGMPQKVALRTIPRIA
jgi:hypothetical protein